MRANVNPDLAAIAFTFDWSGVWNVAPDALIPAHSVFQGSFRDTQVHFTNFQNLILKAKINPVPALGRRHHATICGKHWGNRCLTKFANPEFWRETGIGNYFSGGNIKMHARPVVKEILIARKLKRWSTLCQCRHIEPHFSRARARKTYWRLFHRYREIAERIGLHEWSVY